MNIQKYQYVCQCIYTRKCMYSICLSIINIPLINALIALLRMLSGAVTTWEIVNVRETHDELWGINIYGFSTMKLANMYYTCVYIHTYKSTYSYTWEIVKVRETQDELCGINIYGFSRLKLASLKFSDKYSKLLLSIAGNPKLFKVPNHMYM
jgi:hypothetical protein